MGEMDITHWEIVTHSFVVNFRLSTDYPSQAVSTLPIIFQQQLSSILNLKKNFPTQHMVTSQYYFLSILSKRFKAH